MYVNVILKSELQITKQFQNGQMKVENLIAVAIIEQYKANAESGSTFSSLACHIKKIVKHSPVPLKCYCKNPTPCNNYSN